MCLLSFVDASISQRFNFPIIQGASSLKAWVDLGIYNTKLSCEFDELDGCIFNLDRILENNSVSGPNVVEFGLPECFAYTIHSLWNIYKVIQNMEYRIQMVENWVFVIGGRILLNFMTPNSILQDRLATLSLIISTLESCVDLTVEELIEKFVRDEKMNQYLVEAVIDFSKRSHIAAFQRQMDEKLPKLKFFVSGHHLLPKRVMKLALQGNCDSFTYRSLHRRNDKFDDYVFDFSNSASLEKLELSSDHKKIDFRLAGEMLDHRPHTHHSLKQFTLRNNPLPCFDLQSIHPHVYLFLQELNIQAATVIGHLSCNDFPYLTVLRITHLDAQAKVTLPMEGYGRPPLALLSLRDCQGTVDTCCDANGRPWCPTALEIAGHFVADQMVSLLAHTTTLQIRLYTPDHLHLWPFLFSTDRAKSRPAKSLPDGFPGRSLETLHILDYSFASGHPDLECHFYEQTMLTHLRCEYLPVSLDATDFPRLQSLHLFSGKTHLTGSFVSLLQLEVWDTVWIQPWTLTAPALQSLSLRNVSELQQLSIDRPTLSRLTSFECLCDVDKSLLILIHHHDDDDNRLLLPMAGRPLKTLTLSGPMPMDFFTGFHGEQVQKFTLDLPMRLLSWLSNTTLTCVEANLSVSSFPIDDPLNRQRVYDAPWMPLVKTWVIKTRGIPYRLNGDLSNLVDLTADRGVGFSTDARCRSLRRIEYTALPDSFHAFLKACEFSLCFRMFGEHTKYLVLRCSEKSYIRSIPLKYAAFFPDLLESQDVTANLPLFHPRDQSLSNMSKVSFSVGHGRRVQQILTHDDEILIQKREMFDFELKLLDDESG